MNDCQTKKIFMLWGLQKFMNGYLGICSDGLQLSKAVTNDA